MSVPAYFKIECASCKGHIEFPKEIHGQTIACPHCGLTAVLRVPGYEPEKNCKAANVRFCKSICGRNPQARCLTQQKKTDYRRGRDNRIDKQEIESRITFVRPSYVGRCWCRWIGGSNFERVTFCSGWHYIYGRRDLGNRCEGSNLVASRVEGESSYTSVFISIQKCGSTPRLRVSAVK
jgi:DNA-directed RNA polymerase subunit RPC12/RpoP